MSDTIDKILDAVIKAEGGAKMTNDPLDGGRRTQFGISERAHPEAWADNKVTEEEARAIYRKKYLESTGIVHIKDWRLQHLMCDMAVLHGPGPTIHMLQRLIGLTVDGILGPKSLAAANGHDPVILTNKLVAERIRLIAKIVSNNPSQSRFVLGWINRCLEFWIY